MGYNVHDIFFIKSLWYKEIKPKLVNILVRLKIMIIFQEE
jgi:hypothetical protein